MKRQRRRGIYDYKEKGWKTFYENNEGKIVFDKGLKTNREVRKIVSKNLGKKRKEDIINKKQSKRFSVYYREKAEAAKEIDRILKKKKLTKEDKKELTTAHSVTSYKQETVLKLTQPKRKKAIPKEDIDEIKEFELFCTFHNTTSPQFFASKTSKKVDKETGRAGYGNYHGFKEIKKSFEKFDKTDDIFIKFMGLEKKVRQTDFKSLKNFNSYMTNNFISGRGKMDYTKGNQKIIITGIKKK